jgi:hypothetical protein
MFKPPGDCPVCGTEVIRGAKACPECGADEKSGWKGNGGADGLDLPEDEFDYDSFVAEEFGAGKSRRSLHPLWVVTGVVLGVILLFFLTRI